MTSPAERFHTKQRLLERYALNVTSDDIFQLAKRIAHGQAELLARQSRYVAHWLIEYRGVTLRLVFDSQRRSILTALPAGDSPEYLDARRLRGERNLWSGVAH